MFCAGQQWRRGGQPGRLMRGLDGRFLAITGSREYYLEKFETSAKTDTTSTPEHMPAASFWSPQPLLWVCCRFRGLRRSLLRPPVSQRVLHPRSIPLGPEAK